MKIQQFFFESSDLGSSSTDFVTNFLNFWDTDRNQLLGLYTPQSQFSLSVDSSMPSSSVAESDQNPSFGYYLSSSRNISKVSSEKSIQQRLSLGPEFIGKNFQSIPKTKHHLQDQPNDYSMEVISYPQVNGFIITLHGFFEETDKPEIDPTKSSGPQRSRRFNHGHNSSTNRLSKKSFDRTWVIVPTGNGVVIASDLLTVRPYATPAWIDNPVQNLSNSSSTSLAIPPSLNPAQQGHGQLPIAPQMSTPGVTSQSMPIPVNQSLNAGTPLGVVSPLAPTLQLPPDVQVRLNPVQLEILNKLHIETKLNAEYSYMLAEQSGWNYDVAVKGFQNSVNNIPREAFVQ